MSIVRKEIETIDANKILTADDSGKVFMVGHATVPFAITLPAPTTAGLIFKFIYINEATVVTITSTANNILGVLSVGNPEIEEDGGATHAINSNRVACVSQAKVLFAANALKGDSLEFISNGVNYYVTGLGAHNQSFTTATV
jgi:hypothetical protein